jgi:uncharacterized membrane protein
MKKETIDNFIFLLVIAVAICAGWSISILGSPVIIVLIFAFVVAIIKIIIRDKLKKI